MSCNASEFKEQKYKDDFVRGYHQSASISLKIQPKKQFEIDDVEFEFAVKLSVVDTPLIFSGKLDTDRSYNGRKSYKWDNPYPNMAAPSDDFYPSVEKLEVVNYTITKASGMVIVDE